MRMERNEIITIAAVVVVIAAGVFLFLASQNANRHTVIENTLLVESADPVGDIQKRVVGNKVMVEQRLVAGNSSTNSFVAIMSSEIARGLALRNVNVTVYALVEGGEDICLDTNCTGASIVVQEGSCNCVRFDEARVIVEGDGNFLMDQAVRAGRLMGYAVFKRS